MKKLWYIIIPIVIILIWLLYIFYYIMIEKNIIRIQVLDKETKLPIEGIKVDFECLEWGIGEGCNDSKNDIITDKNGIVKAYFNPIIFAEKPGKINIKTNEDWYGNWCNASNSITNPTEKNYRICNGKIFLNKVKHKVENITAVELVFHDNYDSEQWGWTIPLLCQKNDMKLCSSDYNLKWERFKKNNKLELSIPEWWWFIPIEDNEDSDFINSFVAPLEWYENKITLDYRWTYTFYYKSPYSKHFGKIHYNYWYLYAITNNNENDGNTWFGIYNYHWIRIIGTDFLSF